jgi:hypothetical protein
MHVIAWTLGEPGADARRFVGSVIVRDDVHLRLRRQAVVDAIQKFTELEGAMAAMSLADDVAALGIERGNQRGGAMATVVVAAPFRLTRSQGSSGAVRSRA